MIVAVDEADDLFAGVDEENAATRHGSKVFMNRLVERVAGPTIWIVNDIDRLGPAVVRRMNLVMRFPKPSLAVRKRMIARISDRAEFRLDADETARTRASSGGASAYRKRDPLRRAHRRIGKGGAANSRMRTSGYGVARIRGRPDPAGFRSDTEFGRCRSQGTGGARQGRADQGAVPSACPALRGQMERRP